MSRTILATVVTAALLGGGLPWTVAHAVEPVCGDVNGSNTVSAPDALLVLQKGVGQPVVLDCSGYEDAIDGCEFELAESDADLAFCQAQLADVSGELDQCTSEASCGNGEVDAVGEHCDGEDLDGYDCNDLGYDAGTLACHENCDFDPLRCFDCASHGGTVVDKFCWFLGPAGDSCTDVCDGAGLIYDVATWDFAGSGAPDASGCVAVRDALAPGVPPATPLDAECGGGFSGCTVDVPSNQYARCVSPPTTAGASAEKQRRFCACRKLVLIF